MENRNYQQMDEEVIDLKELMLYILRKWRVLILAGLIGVVIGCAFGLLKPEKSIDDLEIDKLHLKEINQYVHYQRLYDEQVRKEEESVYMNMDPENVWRGSKIYYLTAYESDLTRINEMYNSIFRNERIYYDLIDASGLNCTEMAIRDLAWVSFSKYDREEKENLFGKRERSFQVSIGTVAPTEEACRAMLNMLDERVQGINRLVERTYPNAKYELISDSCKVGYDSGVINKRSESAEILASYINQMGKLKKDVLTDDDMLYYSEVYLPEEEKEIGLGWLKWGIVIGVLFGGMMVCFYGILFLLNDSVKTVDELKNTYGLHLIAFFDGKKKISRCPIDRVLTIKKQYNSEAYLRAALAAMDVKAMHVCGDMENVQLAEKIKQLSGETGITVSDRLAVDEKAQQMVKAAEGVVLYVQLWNTKRDDLVRELEIANHIQVPVLGVVVID